MAGNIVEESSARLLGDEGSSDSEWADGSEVDWEAAPWTERNQNENREGIGTIRRRLVKKPRRVDSFDVEAMEIAGNHGYHAKVIGPFQLFLSISSILGVLTFFLCLLLSSLSECFTVLIEVFEWV